MIILLLLINISLAIQIYPCHLVIKSIPFLSLMTVHLAKRVQSPSILACRSEAGNRTKEWCSLVSSVPLTVPLCSRDSRPREDKLLTTWPQILLLSVSNSVTQRRATLGVWAVSNVPSIYCECPRSPPTSNRSFYINNTNLRWLRRQEILKFKAACSGYAQEINFSSEIILIKFHNKSNMYHLI